MLFLNMPTQIYLIDMVMDTQRTEYTQDIMNDKTKRSIKESD